MTFGDWIKRILKIALPIIIALFVVYHILFYTVCMSESYVDYLSENYEEYVLFTVDEIDWWKWLPWLNFENPFRKTFMAGGYSEGRENVVLFRWDANALKRKMKKELREELESLKQYPCVTGYTYDEDNFIVDVYMDESKAKDWGEYRDVYSYVYDVLERDKFSLLGNFCKRVDHSTHKWYGEFEIHKKEKKVEKLYNENELDTLEEILSRSKQEKPADIKKWEGAEWGEDETGEDGAVFYLTWLDLSSYDDITGELDLSAFTKLRYVRLENMKVNKVILPDSLEYIDPKSFRTCINLEEILIPKSVEKIYGPIFWGCKNLKEVTFEGNAPKVENGQTKVIWKASDEFKICHRKSSDGWDNKCWKQYHMEVLE